jgi:hypothetical protein
MITLQRIESEDAKRFIEILRSEDGTFVLRKYVKKYDREEERWYEVREKPDPQGRFADREMAIAEAKVILGLRSP